MRPGVDATIRQDLADVLMEYSDELKSQFMATEILPIFESQVKSAQFPRLVLDNVAKPVSNGKRAPGGNYDEVQSEYKMIDYNCEEYGLEEPVDDGQSKQLGSWFDAEAAAARNVELHNLRNQEKRAAAVVFNPTAFAGFTGAVGTEWNKPTGTPYSDIQDLIPKLKQQVGGVISGEICLGCSEKVFRNLCKTTEMKNMRKGGPGSVMSVLPPTAAEIASILAINQICFSAAQDNAADIWDDEYAILFIRSKDKNLKAGPQLGRTILWVADSPDNSTVESYEWKKNRSVYVRVRHQVVEKLFNVQAGYLLSNITE
jgi:hypothetical protein